MPAEVVKDVVEGEEYPDGNEKICRLNSAICKPCVYRTHRIKYLIYKSFIFDQAYIMLFEGANHEQCVQNTSKYQSIWYRTKLSILSEEDQ